MKAAELRLHNRKIRLESIVERVAAEFIMQNPMKISALRRTGH